MLVESLVIIGIVAFGVWIAATRFVRSRGHKGWYLTYIGVGSTNPTWQSLTEIKRTGEKSDRRKARTYWNVLLIVYVLFFLVFGLLAHSYLAGPPPR